MPRPARNRLIPRPELEPESEEDRQIEQDDPSQQPEGSTESEASTPASTRDCVTLGRPRFAAGGGPRLRRPGTNVVSQRFLVGRCGETLDSARLRRLSERLASGTRACATARRLPKGGSLVFGSGWQAIPATTPA